MTALLIGLLLLVVVVQILRWFAHVDVKTARKAVNWGGLGLIVLVIVGLVVTGRMGAALAGLAALFAWGGRILGLMHMGKQFTDMFGKRGQNGQGDGQNRSRSPSKSAMTAEEAYRILGLAPGASDDDIKAAYRRLMGQMHPDHGGSDYLAAQINQAKDVLLKRAG